MIHRPSILVVPASAISEDKMCDTTISSSAAKPRFGSTAVSTPPKEASLLGWFGSVKFMAAVAGVFAGIWILFP